MALNNPYGIASIDKYVTDASSNLQKSTQPINQAVSIPKRSVTTLVYTYTDQPAAISIVDDAQLQVYPNPVKAGEAIQCSAVSSDDYRASIYTLSGQLILNQAHCTNGSITIPAKLAKGTYLLIIEGKEISIKQKLIVF